MPKKIKNLGIGVELLDHANKSLRSALQFPSSVGDKMSPFWNYKYFANGAVIPTGLQAREIDLTGWITQTRVPPFISNTSSFPVGGTMFYRYNFTPQLAKDIEINISTLFPAEFWFNSISLGSLASGDQTLVIPKEMLIFGGNNVLVMKASGGTLSIVPYYLYRYPTNLPNQCAVGNTGCYPNNEYIANTSVSDTVIGLAFAHQVSNSYGQRINDIVYRPDLNTIGVDGNGIHYYIALRVFSQLYANGGYQPWGVGVDRVLMQGTSAQPNTITFNPIM